jgi:ABC-type transporter Mla subunit MlaD
MRIKRFNESVDDISPDRTKEIINWLTDLSDSINGQKNHIESIIKELENYKSESKKGNDQIDDSILSLDTLNAQFSKSIENLDNVVNSLNSYIDDGRDFIYTEK